MSEMKQAEAVPPTQISSDDSRRLWVEAVEQMAQNAELKKRVDFLERQIATNAFGGWQLH